MTTQSIEVNTELAKVGVADLVNMSKEENKSLSVHSRPDILTHVIDEAFQKLSKLTGSKWNFNGDKASYRLFNYRDEYQFIKQIILNSPEQKEFLFLDLGAGQFGFSQYICEKLERDKTIPEDIKVKFVSVRGESSKEPYKVITSKKCTQYNLSAFPVEQLETAFQRVREIHPDFPQMEGNVDFSISKMTFLHLVDPLGTLVQAYQMLKPETGLLMSDGFYCELLNDYHSASNDRGFFEGFGQHHTLYLALILSGAQVLINPEGISARLHQFILKRKDGQQLNIPLQYSTRIADSSDATHHQHKLATYQVQNETWAAFLGSALGDNQTFVGDKALYIELEPYFAMMKPRCLSFDEGFEFTRVDYPCPTDTSNSSLSLLDTVAHTFFPATSTNEQLSDDELGMQVPCTIS